LREGVRGIVFSFGSYEKTTLRYVVGGLNGP
jgi:hypothetical protein